MIGVISNHRLPLLKSFLKQRAMMAHGDSISDCVSEDAPDGLTIETYKGKPTAFYWFDDFAGSTHMVTCDLEKELN